VSIWERKVDIKG